jgi:uncharacterized protein DUF3631
VDETSRLSAIELGRVHSSVPQLLNTKWSHLEAEISRRINARIAAAKQAKVEVEEGGSGQALTYPPIKPWPDPVNGAELLTEIAATLPQYVRLSNAEYDAVALAMMHLHAFDFFDVMPIVAISSPQKRSGKTRLLRLAARVSPKALFISGNTAAFLVRAIDRDHPSVFADEYDAVTKGDPEKAEAMRAHLNALFDREGSYVGKCIPTENGHEPRRFTVWSTLWLAGIKNPPPTIEDRAIQIRPKRKLPGDKVKPLRLKDGPEFDVFRRKAARFAIDNERALRNANPSSPDGLAEYSDRAADAWSPLFAIAQVAGEPWLERAHRAALVLSGLQDEAGDRGEAATDTDDELALLVDTRTILLAIDALAPEAKDLRTDKQIAVKALRVARELADAGKEPDKPPKVTLAIGGEQLANALGSPALFPDRGWSEWRHARPIKSNHIVAILREYGIVSKSVRLPDNAGFLWGFSRDALDDAFARYAPSPPAYPPGSEKSASRPHSTENVEENASDTKPHGSTRDDPKTSGDTSNSAGFKGREGAKTEEHTNPSTAPNDDPLHQNSASGGPNRPHVEPVNVPRGATRRRRTGGAA